MESNAAVWRNTMPPGEERAKAVGRLLAAYPRQERGLRLPGEPNYPIRCACGCGAVLMRYDERGRPRQEIHGHNHNAAPVQDAVLALLVDGPRKLEHLVAETQRPDTVVMRAVVDLMGKGKVRRVRRGWYARGCGMSDVRPMYGEEQGGL